jgi:hypothetical protein
MMPAKESQRIKDTAVMDDISRDIMEWDLAFKYRSRYVVRGRTRSLGDLN